MPRSSRFLCDGYTYHLTHRCHDRRFLLRFARDRDAYRKWLRISVRRYEVPVYGYCITGNHVHLIVHVDDRVRVGLMMHLVAGAFAQQFNRRKKHGGSVWEHPYQCTLVQDGQHLLNCLRYVSLNMFRAGVVRHPTEWRWCGHDELVGQRLRYRILDMDRLLGSLDMGSVADLRRVYTEGIEDSVQRQELSRESEWTEALAVGDKTFVEGVCGRFTKRSTFVYSEMSGHTDRWTVRDRGVAYSPVPGANWAAKTR